MQTEEIHGKQECVIGIPTRWFHCITISFITITVIKENCILNHFYIRIFAHPCVFITKPQRKKKSKPFIVLSQ